MLRKIAGDCEAELRVLGSNLKKTGYIGEVKSVISEFTQYDIQEETLEQMIEEVKDSSNLYYKLQDIKTIYHGFREYLREKYITGEELLDVLCTVVGKSKILKTVWLYWMGLLDLRLFKISFCVNCLVSQEGCDYSDNGAKGESIFL